MTESLRNTLQSYQTRYSSGQNSHTPWPYTTLRNDNPLHVICHKHLLLIPVQLLFHCLPCHKPHLSVSNHQITVAIFVLEHTHFWHSIHISYVHLQKYKLLKPNCSQTYSIRWWLSLGSSALKNKPTHTAASQEVLRSSDQHDPDHFLLPAADHCPGFFR